jgi:tRNA(Ile2) C34 agmatinyltransferase TiaS
MPQVDRPICPRCHSQMILALPPGGKGRRTFQCFDCDRPDPLRSEGAKGWLQGELHPPE